MTREEYEMAVKAVIETAMELMKNAKNDLDKVDVMIVQNLQIQALTNEFLRNK